MENREAFTGISAEPEESIDEIRWKCQGYNHSTRGKGYSNRNYQPNKGYQHTNSPRGISYDQQSNRTGKKVNTGNNSELQCMLCDLKGHKVTNCRKLARAKELLRKDKQKYWNERRNKQCYMPRNNKSSQINEVEETGSASKEEFSQEEDFMDQEGIEEVNFLYSEFTEEEDLTYYNDD